MHVRSSRSSTRTASSWPSPDSSRVHERQVGAVDITLDSHELRGDRQRARRCRRRCTDIKITGELRAAADRGRRAARRRPSRGRPDPAAVLRPVSRRGAARRRLRRSARSRARAAPRRRRAPHCVRRRAACSSSRCRSSRLPKPETPASTGLFDRVELESARSHSRQPRAARQEAPPGRADQRLARRHEHHRRRRPATSAKTAGSADHAARHRRTPCAAPISSRAASSTSTRDGTLRFTGEPELNPVLDVTATRQIPEHRRRGAGPDHRHREGAAAGAHEHAAARRVRHPLADRLQPAGQRARHRRARVARGDRRRHRERLHRRRRSASRSAARSTLDLFEITTSAEGDTLGAGITLGQQIGERTFVKLRQQFGERTYHRVPARVSARRLPAPGRLPRRRKRPARPTASASAASSGRGSI